MRQLASTLALMIGVLGAASAVAQPRAAQTVLTVHAADSGLYCALARHALADATQLAALDSQACTQLLAKREQKSALCAIVPADTEARCRRALGKPAVLRPLIAVDLNPLVAEKSLWRVVRRPDKVKGVSGLSFVRLPFGPATGRLELQMVTQPPSKGGTCPNKRVDAQALGVYSLLKPSDAIDEHKTHCTLTRISDTQFLTAAHCLQSIDTAVIALMVRSASNQWITTVLDCKRPAFPVDDFGDSSKSASKVDLAVCTASGGQSATAFGPARLLTGRSDLMSLVSKPVFVAGLGQDEDLQIGLVGFGNARFERAPAADSTSTAPPEGTDLYKGRVDGTAECTASARDGDSGGAVYDHDVAVSRRLLGIISRVKLDSNERTTYFVPFAKRAPCLFLQAQGALPAGTTCDLTIE